MTIKVKISHEEPTNKHAVYVGILEKLPKYEERQFTETFVVEPGASREVLIHSGKIIQVWEAPNDLERKVFNAIDGKTGYDAAKAAIKVLSD